MFIHLINTIKSFGGRGPTHSRIGLRQLCAGIKSTNDPSKLSERRDTELTVSEIFRKTAEFGEAEIDWGKAMNVIKYTEEAFPLKKPTIEELENVRASRPTVSLASLVNESDTLKKMVDLGVELWRMDRDIDLVTKLDFERDVAPMVRFLADIGVPHDLIGIVISRTPGLMEARQEDLTARVRYLLSKKFTMKEISEIIVLSPGWLLFSVEGIDSRLGFLQKTFKLSGNEIRRLVVDCPRLIILKNLKDVISRKNFMLIEEMGFTKEEIKKVLLTEPLIYAKTSQIPFIEQFEVLHIQAGIPHAILAEFPSALRRDYHISGGRHKFLVFIKRNQYDPDLPNYITPYILAESTEVEFCEEVGVKLEFYQNFLRTI